MLLNEFDLKFKEKHKRMYKDWESRDPQDVILDLEN